VRLVADISAFQTHDANDWTIRRPYDLDSFAGAVDAAWVRWTDWYGFVRWGPDPDYALCIDTLRDHGRLVGPYLYPRPGMSDPLTQVRAWRVATPPFTWAPMLDLEDNGGLSGPDVSRWADTALAEMTQQFQRVPWLYTQASKVAAWGLTRPTTPHLLILSEYHFGAEPFSWTQRAGWETRAFSKWGGPDVPRSGGWDHYDAWQFTSSAEVPGMPGPIDASFVTEQAFVQSGGGPEGGFTDMERDVLRGFGINL
jgi:hypothetical protein